MGWGVCVCVWGGGVVGSGGESGGMSTCSLQLWGTVNDYLELFLQFGYIYLFSSDFAFMFTV